MSLSFEISISLAEGCLNYYKAYEGISEVGQCFGILK
jgi:hypothetical protein